MKRLLAAIVAGIFSVAFVGAYAADKADDNKNTEKSAKAKKGDGKKGEGKKKDKDVTK